MPSVRWNIQRHSLLNPVIYGSAAGGTFVKSGRAWNQWHAGGGSFVSRQSLAGIGSYFEHKIEKSGVVEECSWGVKTGVDHPGSESGVSYRITGSGAVVGPTGWKTDVGSLNSTFRWEITAIGTMVLKENGTTIATWTGVTTPLYLSAFFYSEDSFVAYARLYDAICGGALTAPSATAPTAPIITATSGHKRNHIGITFPAGCNGVSIYRSTSPNGHDFEQPIVQEWRHPVYEDKELTNGTTYYYKARASVDGLGESSASVEVSATPTNNNIPAMSEEIGFVIGAPIMKPIGDATAEADKNFDELEERFIFYWGLVLPKRYPGEAINGTVSVVNGSKVVTGSGTTFLADYDPDRIILISNGDGSHTFYYIKWVESNTVLHLWTAYTGPTGSNRPHQPQCDDNDPGNNRVRGYGNYYDTVLSLYQLYYRTGNVHYRNMARVGANMYRNLEESPGFEDNGEYAENPRTMGLMGMAVCALESGDTSYWTTIKGYVDNKQFWLTAPISNMQNGGYWPEDYRERAYMCQYAAILGKAHPDPAVRSSYTTTVLNWWLGFFEAQAARYPDHHFRMESLTYYAENYRGYHYHQPFISAIAWEAGVMVHKLTGNATVKNGLLAGLTTAMTFYDNRMTTAGYRVRMYPYASAHTIETPIQGETLNVPPYTSTMDNDRYGGREPELSEPIPAYTAAEVNEGHPRMPNPIHCHQYAYAYHISGNVAFLNHLNELLDSTYAESDGFPGAVWIISTTAKNCNEAFRRGPTAYTYRDLLAPQGAGDTVAPSTPVLNSATVNSSSAITIAWSASSDNVAVSGYETRVNGGSWATRGNILSYQYTGLSASTQYTFEVRSYDTSGNRSGISNFLSATTSAAGAAPAAPTNGVVDDTANTFNWTNNPLFTALSSYEYTLNAGSSWTTVTAKPISVGNVSLNAGQVGVRVKAVNGNPASATLFNASAFNMTGGGGSGANTCKIYPQYPIRIRVGEQRSIIAAGMDTFTITTTSPVSSGLQHIYIPVQALPYNVSADRWIKFNNGQGMWIEEDASAGATQIKVNNTGSGLPSGAIAPYTNQVNKYATFTNFQTSNNSIAQIVAGWADDGAINVQTAPPPNMRHLKGVAFGNCTVSATYNGTPSTPITVIVDDPNMAPSAAIAEGNQTARVGQVVEFSFEDSRGVERIRVDWGDGDFHTENFSACHAYTQAGSYTVTLTVTNAAGVTDVETRTVTIQDWSTPSISTTCTTLAQIHAAYDAWNGTSDAEIVIPAGTVMVGRLHLRYKANVTGWMTIRSSATLPGPKVRLTAAEANKCFKIVGSHGNQTVVVSDKAISNIRIMGMQVEPFYAHHQEGNGIATGYLIQLPMYGEEEGDYQQTEADNPKNIILQNCLINPHDDTLVIHAILLDSYKTSVIASTIINIKGFGGQDTQAIVGFNSVGSHSIINCELEGSAENVMYGGVIPSIPDLVTKNIEIRRCYLPKRDIWRTWNPDWHPINEKNIFEIKNCRRVYIEGCVLSNHWDAYRSQYHAIVLKSATSPGTSGEMCPQSICEEAVVENTKIDTVFGFYTSSVDAYGLYPFGGLRPHRTWFKNVWMHNITATRQDPHHPGRPRGIQPNHSEYLTLEHLTMVQQDGPDVVGSCLFFITSTCYGFRLRDSITTVGDYAFSTGSSTAPGLQPLNFGTGGTTGNQNSKDADADWHVRKNVFVNYKGFNYPNFGQEINASVNSIAGVGFNNFAEADIELAPSSPYKGYASDGTDPGVKVPLLQARTYSAISGAAFDAGATPVTPSAPTNGVVDDTADTFDWTNNPSYTLPTDYEYTLNGGISYTTATQKPIVVGDITIAEGQVGVRVRAMGSNPASATLFNTSPFIGAGGTPIVPPAPTNAVVNNVADTFDWTNSTGYSSLSDYEYTLNGGSGYSNVTTKPIQIGNIALSAGQVGVRVKAAVGRSASSTLYNPVAFTVASQGQVSYVTWENTTNINSANNDIINANPGSMGKANSVQRISPAEECYFEFGGISATGIGATWVGLRGAAGLPFPDFAFASYALFFENSGNFYVYGAHQAQISWNQASDRIALGFSDTGKFQIWKNGIVQWTYNGTTPQEEYVLYPVMYNDNAPASSGLSDVTVRASGGASTVPNPPTNGVVNDVNDTFDWTNNPSYTNLSDYEYTLNGGVSWATVTEKPVVVGNIAKATGQVGVRVKAMNGNFASTAIYNNSAFNITGGTPVTPAAPTSGVVNDVNNTFDWTNNPLFTDVSSYEYTLDGGSSWAPVTAKPVLVGNVAKAAGQVGVRVKSIGINPASAALYSSSVFTVLGEDTNNDGIITHVWKWITGKKTK